MPITAHYRANTIFKLLRNGPWQIQGQTHPGGYGAVGGSGVTPHPLSVPINRQFRKGLSHANPQLGIPPAAILIDRETHDSIQYEVPEHEWLAYLEEVGAKPGLTVLWHCRIRQGKPTAMPNPEAPIPARVALKVAQRLIEAGLVITLTPEQTAELKVETEERLSVFEQVEAALTY